MSLCKHQREISRTRELTKMRPMTHGRMFSYFFIYTTLFSEGPRRLLIMSLACLLFFRDSSLWL